MSTVAAALARHLLHEAPPGRPRSRADLGRLPSPVARLLEARLDARVDREAAPPESPWTDPEHPALRSAREAWRSAARAAARVPADAWEEELAEAAALAVRHLVDPAQALAETAFADAADPLPTPLVLARIRAASPYPYVPEIVERYVEKKGLAHVDRDGLETLLRRIDTRMVAGFSADEWLELLAPLFGLLGPVGEPAGTVPARLVREAFEARGHGDRVASLDASPVSPDALRAALAVPRETRPERPSETEIVGTEAVGTEIVEPEPSRAEAGTATEPPVAEAAAPSSDVEVVEAERVAPAPPVIGSRYASPEETAPDDSGVLGTARPVEVVAPIGPMEPLEMSEAPVRDAVVTEVEEVSDEAPLWQRLARPAGPALGETTRDGAAPLWAQFAGAGPTSGSPSPSAPAPRAATVPDATAPIDDLEAAVLGSADAERRAWYIEELFGGSAPDYRATLARLDAARTWTEATDVIARDVFRKHRVNIYSEPAVAFTDAVEIQIDGR